MVVADINILCVCQKEKEQFCISKAHVDCYDLKRNDIEFLYNDRYLSLKDLEGVLYQIYPEARDQGNYNKEFLDLCSTINKHKVVFLSKKFKDELIALLKELCLESHQRTLYCWFDLQGYEEKYIKVDRKSFLEMVLEENLYFNTIYHIVE